MILKPLLAALAKERQKRKPKDFVPQKSAEQTGIETREELAKLAGVSRDTISKTEFVRDNATEEQKTRARMGGTGNSLNAIYTEVRYAKAAEQGETERRCIDCGKTKKLNDFDVDRNRCKECNSKLRRKREPAKPNKNDMLNQIVADMYDNTQTANYTIEHLT